MKHETINAGFLIRLLATIIDTIWLYGSVYIVLYYLIGSDLFDLNKQATMTQLFVEWIIPFVVVMIFWVTSSATPGKMLLKLKIVNANTLLPASNLNLFLRYIAYFVSAAPLFLGYFWVILDKNKQGWHDKIANTIVIRINQGKK